jgi:hypothetical protein
VLILEVVTGKPPLGQYGDHLGWKWNGNIPNRTASFSIFYLIEFAFLCPTLPFSLSFSYFKRKSRKRFRHFPTISDRFLLSTFNSEYPEFKIRFKPNLVANHYCPGN